MKKPEKLLELLKKSGCKLLDPVNSKKMDEFEMLFGNVPDDLKKFYSISNGLELNSWRILPIYDEQNIKRTWDSIERANNIKDTKFAVDESMLKNFVIFSEIRGGKCVLYSKETKAIWFETEDEYVETDLTLWEFIENMLLEEKD